MSEQSTMSANALEDLEKLALWQKSHGIEGLNVQGLRKLLLQSLVEEFGPIDASPDKETILMICELVLEIYKAGDSYDHE
jgi:hypothetical protein